jgi:hypothetical protein
VSYGEMVESRTKMEKSTIKKGEEKKKEKSVSDMYTKSDPSIL